MMGRLKDIKVIAFDADDTLWDNQSHFEAAERRYCEILADYGSAEHISAELFRTETANMPLLGYGCKAFVISLVENAVRVSGGRVPASAIGEIVSVGKSLLTIPATPLPGVEPVLSALRESGRYRLAVFTKGELLDQQNKLARSGLAGYFSHVGIVSDKTREEFLALCRDMGIAPSALLMVGNSFRSDIAPALAAGAAAAYIPFHVTWQLEHTCEFGHSRLFRLRSFSGLTEILRTEG